MSSEVLHVERRGRAALLTIDRPHAGNSISAEVTTALDEAIDTLERERGLVAIVITGAGNKFFSSGGDIKQYRQLVTREQLKSAFERPRRLLDRLEALPFPVIAAVNGIAMGGGAEPVDAEEARRPGLINRICDDMPVVEAALALVERLARAAPLSLAATKRVLSGAYCLPRDEARRLAEDEFADLWLSEDHREAEAAFAAKRRPSFKGK
jgi:enoyl-CoA hydratase/carnithine racemase